MVLEIITSIVSYISFFRAKLVQIEFFYHLANYVINRKLLQWDSCYSLDGYITLRCIICQLFASERISKKTAQGWYGDFLNTKI